MTLGVEVQINNLNITEVTDAFHRKVIDCLQMKIKSNTLAIIALFKC